MPLHPEEEEEGTLMRLFLWLVRWFQRSCQHPGDAVRADILQNDVRECRVQWCLACGAYRICHPEPGEGLQPNRTHGEWRKPDAMYADWLSG